MTKRRLRELYEMVRVAAHATGVPTREDGESDDLAHALDEIFDECDHASEARMVEWAMANGYPDFDTVVLYAR
jgi:hypothetical protein